MLKHSDSTRHRFNNSDPDIITKVHNLKTKCEFISLQPGLLASFPSPHPVSLHHRRERAPLTELWADIALECSLMIPAVAQM